MRQVTLMQDHNEGGVQYVKGQVVLLPDESAKFLISAMLATRAASVEVVQAEEPVANAKAAK